MNHVLRSFSAGTIALAIGGCNGGELPKRTLETEWTQDIWRTTEASPDRFRRVEDSSPKSAEVAFRDFNHPERSQVLTQTLSQPSPAANQSSPKTPDVVYVPTPQPVVDKMLDVAGLKKGDVIYDLGCGDGRIVVTAAKRFGVKAYGFDVDPERVAEARANVKKNKVEHLVTIEQKDIFELDLKPASVVTMYLLPELNRRLIPQLRKLKPGSRIVSHDFDMKPIEPDEVIRMERPKKTHWVYLWQTPI